MRTYMNDNGYRTLNSHSRYERYIKEDVLIEFDTELKKVKVTRLSESGNKQPRYATMEEVKQIYEYCKIKNWL